MGTSRSLGRAEAMETKAIRRGDSPTNAGSKRGTGGGTQHKSQAQHKLAGSAQPMSYHPDPEQQYVTRPSPGRAGIVSVNGQDVGVIYVSSRN
jgi:hypothetical protein